jgi:indolepyruvate/phenylpyruvate decarboxylase
LTMAMKVGEYLFEKVRSHGVEHVFGIPGDYAIPLYRALEASGLRAVVNTHEPAAGFAADAYARLRGLGVVVVTFGAGALNMVNSIAQAYAEKSPVIVISGAPEILDRRIDALLHHKVKTFESQLNVYREITGAAVSLTDSSTASDQIDQIFETAMRTKRPGYIEVPRDLVGARMAAGGRSRSVVAEPDQEALREAFREVVRRLNSSRRPVVYAGVEIARFGLIDKTRRLVEKLNVPVVTSIEGKAVFPEDHANFSGIYMGRAGSESAREAVESSDCLLMLGAFLTDVSTGVFSARIDRSTLISASSDEVIIGHHRYSGVTLTELLNHLLSNRGLRRRKFVTPSGRGGPTGPVEGRLTTHGIVEELNSILVHGRHVVVSDVGDCLYAGIELRTDAFLGPGYYNSMGFGVPAAVAAQLALPKRRAIALVGDGGFRMTGMEVTTAKKLGLNPIIIVWDNSAYATLQAIGGKRDYFELNRWDFVAIAEALGGRGVRATTKKSFKAALRAAERSAEFFIIDAVIASTDISPTWRNISREVAARMEHS